MSENSKNRTGQRKTSAGAGRASGKRTGQASARTRNSERITAVQNARSLGTGTGRRSSATNRRRKRRRQGPDIAKLLLIGIGIVILLLCIAVGLKGCAKEDGEKDMAEEIVMEPETELEADITVNGISVHGMTKTEAKEAVLNALGWELKADYNGDVKEIPNLLEANVDAVLEEAFSGVRSGEYTVSADGLENAAKEAADTLAAGWDVKAKNGSISSYDQASGSFVFSGAENGKSIKREQLASDILSSIKAGEYKKTIAVSADEVAPEISEAEAKASFKRIGTFTTTTTSNKDRNENIRIASSALNGVIVQPGEEFSFNLTTGNRTTEKGYKAAGAYVNGVLVEEPGGGVCQVSSTLYNAVVFSGLKTTERHAHSYEPSYVTPGEDAMVSYDGYSGPDMKFVNNSKTAVGIKTSFSDQKLTISIYGSPILEEGVTLSMQSTKVKELDPPEPNYEEDPTLEPGVEVEAKAATPGSRWVTNLITKKNGEVVSDVLLHNSTYRGKAATIKRNTSGTVASTEGESSMSGENGTGAEGDVTEPTVEGNGAAGTDTLPTTAPDENIHPDGPGTETVPAGENIPQGPADATVPAENAGPGNVEPGADPANSLIDPR